MEAVLLDTVSLCEQGAVPNKSLLSCMTGVSNFKLFLTQSHASSTYNGTNTVKNDMVGVSFVAMMHKTLLLLNLTRQSKSTGSISISPCLSYHPKVVSVAPCWWGSIMWGKRGNCDPATMTWRI